MTPGSPETVNRCRHVCPCSSSDDCPHGGSCDTRDECEARP